MKILILGASGTVGNPLFHTLKCETDYEIHGTFHKNKPTDAVSNHWHEYNTADNTRLKSILKSINPDIIISSLNANFEEQLDAHKHIQETKAHIIFISTANVFDGDIRGGHTEDKATYPISNYGKFKETCEAMFPKGLIIRLPKILDAATVEKWTHDALTGQSPIYSNLYMSLNTPQNVADAIKFCIDTGKMGTLHLTSTDSISIDCAVRQMLAHKGIPANYTPAELSIQSYCNLLGCHNPEQLRHNNDNTFRLGLTSKNRDIISRFQISCAEAVATALGPI